MKILFLLLLTCAANAADKQIVNPFGNTNTLKALEANKRQQIEASKSWKTFHDFQFSDEIEKTGITFEQRPVDDGAKNYIAVHYDHGNGLAVADVDADGRLDFYFVNQVGGSQLWRATGKGKFENITASAGVGLEDKIGVAASFGDIDNDGLPDLFVTTVRGGNHLFKNLGSGKFADITEAAGLSVKRPLHSSGAVLFDFNRDGLLDLFVCNVGNYTRNDKGRGGFYLGRIDAFSGWRFPNRSEQSVLYQNLGGGKFEDVSKRMGLEHFGWSGDATVCDINSDGFQDLYVLSMSGDDKLYLNDAGKRFIEATASYFPKTPWGAMGAKFFDFDLDGALDLYVTDMHSDMTGAQIAAGDKNISPLFEKAKSDPWCTVEWSPEALRGATNNIMGNAFYRNLGGGKFKEISSKVGTETYWPWGVTVADFNADGYEDVFVTAGMGYPLRYAINSLLLNEGGARFVDSEFVLGIEPRRNNRIEKEFFDLDCSEADKRHNLCRGRTGAVTVVGSLSSRSSAAVDIDEDGDLDIVTNEWADRPMALLSNLSERKNLHYLQIKLTGAGSAVGATVRVFAGGKIYTRYNDGKSGYLSQSVMPLYFGLGDATQVEKIEVTWPSGTKRTVSEAFKAGQTIVIADDSQRSNTR